MKTSCPNCGAEIEFRYDDSFVRICSHCNHAVERTDRGVETLGKVADLVPIDSPLKLFAEGHFGSTSFLLVGMAQIRHAQGGVWQEWYAKFDGGRWGWLAEAQGRYYLTFEDKDWKPVDLRALAPGHSIDLPVRGAPHPMAVAEATSGTYISARGELPFKLVPNEVFHYADLADGKGTFATIDYGDGETPPALYVGAQVPLADLKLTGGEVGPTPSEPTITSKRLACPSCNAPIELHAPDQSQRVVCAYCNTMLDTSSGDLQILSKLAQKPVLQIPLGSKATFIDGEVTVIGYVQRSAYVDGTWWPFEEYLLYRPDLGFRWLVESDGHWSYVQPVANGAAEVTGTGVRYDKVAFRSFQVADLRVDQVLGELYWKVEVGEKVNSEDYVAAPAMLSRELSETEEDWSLSTYLTVRELHKAFGGTELAIGGPMGIAPNQPDPWTAASAVMSVAFLLLLLVGLGFAIAAKDEQKLAQTLTFTPAGPGSGSASPVASPIEGLPPPAAAVPECRALRVLVNGLMSCGKFDAETGNLFLTAVTANTEVLPDTCKAMLDSFDVKFDDTCKKPDISAALIGTESAGSGSAGSDAGSAAGSNDPGPNVFFSDPVTLDGDKNIQLRFTAPNVYNNWVYIATDLVHEASGQVVNLEANIEYYAGVDDGDSWSEGSHETLLNIGPQPAGAYILRFEGQSGPAGPATVQLEVRQGVFRFPILLLAIAVLGIPLGLVGLVSYLHEKRRWENSTQGKAPVTPVALIVFLFAGVFLIIGAIVKSSRKSND